MDDGRAQGSRRRSEQRIGLFPNLALLDQQQAIVQFHHFVGIGNVRHDGQDQQLVKRGKGPLIMHRLGQPMGRALHLEQFLLLFAEQVRRLLLRQFLEPLRGGPGFGRIQVKRHVQRSGVERDAVAMNGNWQLKGADQSTGKTAFDPNHFPTPPFQRNSFQTVPTHVRRWVQDLTRLRTRRSGLVQGIVGGGQPRQWRGGGGGPQLQRGSLQGQTREGGTGVRIVVGPTQIQAQLEHLIGQGKFRQGRMRGGGGTQKRRDGRVVGKKEEEEKGDDPLWLLSYCRCHCHC
mmetsp:Transcript_11970/g.26498  ORF Transcript_11970/g.26498 Transcript_11970/m.26498 type:complete len:289 (+) Transcript_11970:457-1323(+)